MSDLELIKLYQSTFDQEITETLLKRHSGLIKSLAQNHTIKHPNTSFDDNYQNACVGFICALRRFKENNNVKLTTFLYSSVFYYLLSSNDTESFINCPSNLRKVKSFVAGKYDNDSNKKRQIEKDYKLTDQESVDKFKSKHILLSNDAVTCTDILPDEPCDCEEGMISDLHMKMIFEKMTTDEKYIASLLIEGHTPPQIAKLYSDNFGVPCSGKYIRTKISHMRQFFV